MKRAALALMLAIALNGIVLAAVTGTIACLVVGPDGAPLPNVTVTATSSTGQSFQATTGPTGRATFYDLSLGTYTLTAAVPGFQTATTQGELVADATQQWVIRFEPTVFPPPTAPPPPTPSASPSALTSLLVGYNNLAPDHRPGTSYFGRYSYVLLQRRSDARDGAFIDSLASVSSHVQPMGAPTGLQEPWRYNLFLIPVAPSYRLQNASTGEFLKHYDAVTGLNLRRQYCNMRAHRQLRACVAASNGMLDEGPIVLVFPFPVSGIAFRSPLPPSLALDLSGVPPSQFPLVVARLQKAMTVAVTHDSQVPLNWSDTTVAPAIAAMASALRQAIGALNVFYGK